MTLADVGFRLLLALVHAIAASVALVVFVPLTVWALWPARDAIGLAVVLFTVAVFWPYRAAVAAFWRQLQAERQRRGLR